MARGFAILAYPVGYRNTGFIRYIFVANRTFLLTPLGPAQP